MLNVLGFKKYKYYYYCLNYRICISACCALSYVFKSVHFHILNETMSYTQNIFSYYSLDVSSTCEIAFENCVEKKGKY